MNAQLRIAIANKAHDVFGEELALAHLTDILFPYLIPILFKILRKD